MHDQMLRDILRRLNALERTSARVRVGEVTDVGPLDVALGGSDVPYEDVKAVDGLALDTGDQVAALMWGNDLLVLGAVGGAAIARGAVTLTWPGGSPTTNNVAVTHGFAASPNVALGAQLRNVVAFQHLSATQFQIQGITRDGSSPVGGTTMLVDWIAVI